MIITYASEKCLEAVAFRDGLFALGYEVKTYNASDYGAGQVMPCDAVVISGTRGKGDLIRRDHEAAGIPVIVIDYGYIKRVSGVATWKTGHWQVGIGGLNRPPLFAVPDDRARSLGVHAQKCRGKGVTLVLGQHSGDPSHAMTDGQMIDWAQRKCDETGGYWRPHPDSPDIHVDAPRADGPLQDWLDRAGLVHTICSTGGLEALLNGVPAVAEYPERASWGALSGARFPGVNAIWSHVTKLAYGQWTLDEMRSGEAAHFVLANMRRWND